jgi:lactoylglutathione lyase
VFDKVDCIRFYVENIEEGISYYHNKLGLPISWKMEHAVGFLMNDQITEIVIQNFDHKVETDVKVKSVIEAVNQIVKSGGKIVKGPFDIEIGKCAIIEDPFGNQMTILDMTKGIFDTDNEGNVVGLKKENA